MRSFYTNFSTLLFSLYRSYHSGLTEIIFHWLTEYTFFFLTFIYFWEREHEQGRVRERGRQRIPSRLRAVRMEPGSELELTGCEIMTWATSKRQTLTQLSHPGPLGLYLSYNKSQRGWVNKKIKSSIKVTRGEWLLILGPPLMHYFR